MHELAELEGEYEGLLPERSDRELVETADGSVEGTEERETIERGRGTTSRQLGNECPCELPCLGDMWEGRRSCQQAYYGMNNASQEYGRKRNHPSKSHGTQNQKSLELSRWRIRLLQDAASRTKALLRDRKLTQRRYLLAFSRDKRNAGKAPCLLDSSWQIRPHAKEHCRSCNSCGWQEGQPPSPI